MRISDWSSDVCSSDLVVNEARIIAREFVGVPGHAELLPQLRVALENEPAQPHGTVEVDRRRIGLAALPQIALDRAEVQKGRKPRSEEHTSELQSLMRISYAVFCLKKKRTNLKKMKIPQTNKQKQYKSNNKINI